MFSTNDEMMAFKNVAKYHFIRIGKTEYEGYVLAYDSLSDMHQKGQVASAQLRNIILLLWSRPKSK